MTKKCTMLSSTEARVIPLQRRLLIYFCDDCLGIFKQFPQVINRISVLEAEVKKLQNEIQQLKKTNLPTDISGVQEASTVLSEIHEREIRSRNVIIHGVKECPTQDYKTRSEYDARKCREVLNVLNIQEDNIKVYRIGQHADKKTRPLKIVCESNTLALQIIKKRQEVKKSLPGITIGADLTLAQRTQLKQLHRELEEKKNNGESNFIIRYFNGVPKITQIHNKTSPSSKN